MTPKDGLLRRWRAELSAPHEGWNFDALRGRLTEDEPSWDFDALWRSAIRSASSVLDMGSGGGEQLLRFSEDLPSDTVATEGWPPNVSVARRNLAHAGIPVEVYDAGRRPPLPMPFPNGRFDLVLNRHESYDAAEVRRVLTPSGRFLTQQVAAEDAAETRTWLGSTGVRPDWTLSFARRELEAAGFRIRRAEEWRGHYHFADVATLLAYLHRVSWDAPADFNVDGYVDALLRLHRQAERDGGLILTKSRWLLAAEPA